RELNQNRLPLRQSLAAVQPEIEGRCPAGRWGWRERVRRSILARYTEDAPRSGPVQRAQIASDEPHPRERSVALNHNLTANSALPTQFLISHGNRLDVQPFRRSFGQGKALDVGPSDGLNLGRGCSWGRSLLNAGR